jgi:hypothetical protein
MAEEEGPAGFGNEGARVVATFFRGEQLVSMPAKRSKRAIVLDRIAQDFEPGRHYAESEVNALLQARYADYAALRRYLVDEGLLDRDAGFYWRSGGTFAVEDQTVTGEAAEPTVPPAAPELR